MNIIKYQVSNFIWQPVVIYHLSSIELLGQEQLSKHTKVLRKSSPEEMESSHSEQAEYSDIHDPYVGGQGDEYLADYDPEVLQRLMEEEQYRLYEQMKADYSVYNDCIKPAASQGLQSIWFLLLMCLLLRILSLLKPPPQIINIASAVCGCLVLWHFYEQSMIHILLPCAVGFVLLKFKATCKGSILSLISVAYLLSW